MQSIDDFCKGVYLGLENKAQSARDANLLNRLADEKAAERQAAERAQAAQPDKPNPDIMAARMLEIWKSGYYHS